MHQINQLDQKDFQIKRENPWSKNKNLWNLYKKAETSEKLTSKIFQYSRSIGIEIFSSPFDIHAVDFLEKMIAINVKHKNKIFS